MKKHKDIKVIKQVYIYQKNYRHNPINKAIGMPT